MRRIALVCTRGRRIWEREEEQEEEEGAGIALSFLKKLRLPNQSVVPDSRDCARVRQYGKEIFPLARQDRRPRHDL